MPPIDKNVIQAPHVVILGAGASIAAYKDWGSVGPPLPSMQDLVDVLSLRTLIETKGFNVDGLGFEAFYDDLASSSRDLQLQIEIERRVAEYFGSLRLPGCVTIYDYLILGLRDKDLIASFNWDPFLLQAYMRNEKVGQKRRPRIAFLHGNVSVGICHKDSVTGVNGRSCARCGEPFSPSRLLYPIKHKNYSADRFIKNEWDTLRRYLGRAYYVTVFGYSAPKTDVEARTLMLKDWKENKSLDLAEVDIIDIKPGEEVEASWEEFFVRDHYMVTDNVTNSYIFQHPRRSCDAFASATLMCNPWHDNPFPKFEKLEDLQIWVAPLIVEEETYEREKRPFSSQPLPPNESSEEAQ
jgi:hypothetical protein